MVDEKIEKKESLIKTLQKKLVTAVKKGDFKASARLRESLANAKK